MSEDARMLTTILQFQNFTKSLLKKFTISKFLKFFFLIFVKGFDSVMNMFKSLNIQ